MMPDGNSAALARKMRDDDRDDSLMTIAEAKRWKLVRARLADESNSHQSELMDYLADLAGTDPEFLHALQRGDATRMQQLYEDAINARCGDELVQAEAALLAAEKPCRCRGETCYC